MQAPRGQNETGQGNQADPRRGLQWREQAQHARMGSTIVAQRQQQQFQIQAFDRRGLAAHACDENAGLSHDGSGEALDVGAGGQIPEAEEIRAFQVAVK